MMNKTIYQKRKGQQNYHSGLCAENMVAHDYQQKGCKIVKHRWRCRSGEIDLILDDGDILIFCEVKKRKTISAAFSSITARQQSRIINSALEYLADNDLPLSTDMRFDVAAVDQIGKISVIHNAIAA